VRRALTELWPGLTEWVVVTDVLWFVELGGVASRSSEAAPPGVLRAAA
jgi:hypothetical protein